jgi:hypothetical protein
MPQISMNPHGKRFRSKVPSATCLSPRHPGCLEKRSLDFLFHFHYDTVSNGERGGSGGHVVDRAKA